jgi:hypothetical protein
MSIQLRLPAPLECSILSRADMKGIAMPMDDQIIETPDGPMTWAQWKKKNPVQIPSRRTKGKDLPVKVKRFTSKT